MKIRRYRTSDLESVANLFTASVHELAAAHYDAVQLAAWAPCPPDLAEWSSRLARLRALVAEDDGALAGFIAYEMDGHIDLLYVSPTHAGQGVASALYRAAESALLAAGITDLFTEASRGARPFFVRQGFRVTEDQDVSLRGAVLRRYAMRKSIPVGLARRAGD